MQYELKLQKKKKSKLYTSFMLFQSVIQKRNIFLEQEGTRNKNSSNFTELFD